MTMMIAVENAIHGKKIVWGAPTFDQVRVGWNETKHAAGTIAKFTQLNMTATFPNGGEIIYRSLDDPNNARGHTADGVVIDEAGFVKQEAWYEVLRQMLMDTGGWAWLVGTPNGHNWFWREYQNGLTRDDTRCWQAPSLGCRIENGVLIREPHILENPDLPFEELQNIYHTSTERVFRQEILAEFMESAGGVFRNIQPCMTAQPGDHTGHYIVAGVDWAKSNDFTAVSVGCRDCQTEIAIDRFNQIDFHFQRERIKALCEKHGVKSLLVEKNSIGEPNLEELIRSGLPAIGFTTTATSKPPLIENLALALEKQEWKFISDPVWTGELEAYEQSINSNTGRSSYSAPQGLHDDTVIARALMLRAASRGNLVLFEV